MHWPTPRDIVEKCVNGKIEYAPREDYSPSYREMVSFCTRNHPWATFGNDMLLGIKADLKTDMKQQEFLPENLLYDFDRAQIYANGNYRQLVSERRMAVMPGVQIIESDFPLTPMQCACILLVITVSTNLQILLLNPIALGFIPAVIRKKNKTWPKIQIAMIVLFLIGSIFQHYAEGMLIVALCLLLRVIRFEK